MEIVIIGAGPVGLVTAIGLSQLDGIEKIIILERCSEEYIKETYPTSTSFCYNLTTHVFNKLQNENILTFDRLGRRFSHGGGNSLYIFRNDNQNPKKNNFLKRFFVGTYWFQRRDLMNVLIETAESNSKIQIVWGVKIVDISPTPSDNICITTIYNESESIFNSKIIIACDGANSFVRSVLHKLTNQQRFKTITGKQISTGLLFKSLLLNLPEDLIEHGALGIINDKNNKSFAAIYEQTAASKRLCGFVRVSEDDPLFQADLDEKSLRNILKENTPHFPWEQVLSSEDAQSFCNAGSGIRFPKLCYSTDAVWKNENENQFICLAGDAMHSFPPDTGQGVNASFLDSLRLIELLRKYPNNLAKAMREYENETVREAESICKISPLFSPYQYPQLKKDFGFYKWVLTNGLLFIGNKLLPSAVDKPLIFQRNEDKKFFSMWYSYKKSVGNLQKLACFTVLVLAAGTIVYFT